ncbi:MAG TPA: S9 family peptidase [Candidatus Limnocylindria bacterium]|nr:S9 family peptidase [Candidatus Limnocylindria bacterium]
MTAEDLYAFRFLSDAQISPDGTRVAYAVREVDREKNTYRSAIWLVPFAGGTPARLTAGPGQDALPRWSPDGRMLAFVSDRDAVERPGDPKKRKPKNVFVLPLDGGEARRLTTGDDDCGDLAWSPDGTRIAFTRKDAKAKDAENDEIRVWDRLRYKTDEGYLLDGRRRHVWVVGVDGGDARRITDGDWDDLQPSWSPDGASIAFVSNRTDARETNTVADIHVAGLSGGGWRVTDGVGSYGNPRFSPDGRQIACYGVAKAVGSSAKNVHLFLFPARGDGAGRDLIEGWDRTVGSTVMSDMRAQAQTLAPTWTTDRSRIVFVGSDQGAANVYSVSAQGGDLRAETVGPHQVVSLSLAADAKRFACVYGSAVCPGDVAAGELGRSMRPLTDLNGELLGSRFVTAPERVEFTGADGWTIEGWIMKPRGFDASRRWPLVLEVHGGPHGAYGHGFFHEFQMLAGRGYAVLLTNPRGSHAYGEKFSMACVGDWGGKDYEDLMAGVDHALTLGWVDPKRLYVTGGSYGGFMTNWIVGHTDRFRAAATQRSISNNVSAFGVSDIGWHFWEYEMGDASPWKDPAKLVERSPLTYVPNVKTPLLILHAERDLRCPIEQAEQFFTALRLHGVETQFVRFPEDNHDLTRGGKPRNRVEHARRIADWFDAHP